MVLDTHVFIWFVLGDPKLPTHARQMIQADPQNTFLPSVCAWEATLLAQSGKIAVNSGDPAATVRRWIRNAGFPEAVLTSEIAILSRTLAFEHQDPADRFIAATAYHLDADLATSDTNLRNLKWLKLAY